MAGDLEYGGGGGGGYYPPSFDPNDPMGGGGGYNPNIGTVTPEGRILGDYVTTVQHISSSFNEEYFSTNYNSANPYTKYFDIKEGMISWADYSSIPTSGNQYEIIGYQTMTSMSGKQYTNPIYRVYNNAYTEYETSARNAQQSYYNSHSSEYKTQIDKAESEFVNSYGNIRNSDIRSDVQTLADYKSELAELQFNDDITEYLNRIDDTDNTDRINELQKIISDLENKISQDMLHQARIDEAQRQKDREWFNWDFNYLTDPYFGRSPVLIYSRSPMEPVRQSPLSFLGMSMSGELHDWFAGGTLYDSPRAGDILFNPIGNLNTTVFLGLENQNFAPNLQAVYASPDLHRAFGTLAGDAGFGVLNFGS